MCEIPHNVPFGLEAAIHEKKLKVTGGPPKNQEVISNGMVIVNQVMP